MDYPFCPSPPYVPGDPGMYDLRWMVSQIQSLTALVQGIAKGQESQGGNITALNSAMADLATAQKCIHERLNDGDFENGKFLEWADKNLPSMVTEMVRFVWFGLTPDGHFCAYVPANWGWLTFNTGTDITELEYGHLIITY
jgi:hypothetical protein